MKRPKRPAKTDKTPETRPPVDMGLFVEAWQPVDRDAPRFPWGIENPEGLAARIEAATPPVAAFVAAREALAEHRPLPDLAKDGTPAEIAAAGAAHRAFAVANRALRDDPTARRIAHGLIRFHTAWARREEPQQAFRAAWELCEAWLLWGNAGFARHGRKMDRGKALAARKAKPRKVKASPLRGTLGTAFNDWKQDGGGSLSDFFRWLESEGDIYGLACDRGRVWLEGDATAPPGRTIRAAREWLK